MDVLNKNDEWVTPPEALTPLVKEWDWLKQGLDFIDPYKSKTSIFNTFEDVLKARLLGEGEELKLTDKSFIITNPPLSIKTEVFKRMFTLIDTHQIRGFALLLPIHTLQNIELAQYYQSLNGLLKVRIFKRRIRYYYSDGIKQSANCAFGSMWLIADKMNLNKRQLDWY